MTWHKNYLFLLSHTSDEEKFVLFDFLQTLLYILFFGFSRKEESFFAFVLFPLLFSAGKMYHLFFIFPEVGNRGMHLRVETWQMNLKEKKKNIQTSQREY